MEETIYIDDLYHMTSREETPEPNKDTMYNVAPESTVEAMKEYGIE